MRVLIVQPNIRRYRADFFNALAKNIDQLTVAHFGVDESPATQEFARIRLKDSFWSKLKAIPQLVQEQLKQDVSIVVFDVHYWHVLIAAAVGSIFRPVLFWGHGLGRTAIGRALRRVCLLWGKGLIVYGDGGREQALRCGIDARRIYVARNTQVVPGYSDTSRLQKAYFIFVGRLQERKQIDVLLKAYERYVARCGAKSLGLKVVGDGESADGLKQLAADLGIRRRVQFIAATTDPDELAKLFRNAVAYVSPGDVGLGVLHSFAFGVPVITFRLERHGPEFENVIDNVNGIVLAESVTALSDVLSQLAGDVVMARRLGHEAFKTYDEKAHPDQMVATFLDALIFATSPARGP